MIGGAPGTGKTHQLKDFAQYAAENGAIVLVADARDDTDVPLSVIGQLLESAPPGTYARLLLNAYQISEDRAESDLPGELARQAWSAFCELSQRAPLILMVDDVELADPLSVQCLRYAMRRNHTMPIGIVLSTSVSSHDPSSVVPQPASVHRQWLTLLTLSETTTFLTDYLGAEMAAQLAPTFHAITGGNPLLLVSLLDDHKATVGLFGVETRSLPSTALVPGTLYRVAMRRCLRRGPARMTEVAQALAVLGDEATPDLVAELVEGDRALAATAIAYLEVTGVLHAGRFGHWEVRSAILADIEPGERGRLHRRAAQLRYQRGCDTTTIADHLIAADTAEGPWVVPVLQEAAWDALAEARTSQAISYLDLALKLAPAAGRAEILAHLAMAEWRLSPGRVARLLPEICEALAATPQTDVAITLIKHLLWLGQTENARRELRRLNENGSILPSELHQLRIWLSTLFPPMLEELSDAGRLEQEGLHIPLASRQRIDALTKLRSTAEKSDGSPMTTWSEQLLATSPLTDASYEKIQWALRALLYADKTDIATKWCQKFYDEAVTREAPTWVAGLSAIWAEIAVRLGDMRAAGVHIARAFEQVQPWAWGLAVGDLLATKVNIATARGALDEAEQLLQRPLPIGVEGSRMIIRYLHARGNYQLAAAHPLVALKDFQHCGEIAMSWGLDLPGLAAWRAGAAAAWLAIGERQRAKDLLAEQMVRPGANLPRIHGVTLRLMATALTEPGQRREMAVRAVDRLRRSKDKLEYARALLTLSSCDRKLGRHTEAEFAAQEAFMRAEQCGAEPLVLQAKAALESEGPRSRRVARAKKPAAGEGGVLGRLSDAELRVAHLAARGESNAQIARQLKITVSTVEQHLTRVYRKLDVPGRGHLPAELRLMALPSSGSVTTGYGRRHARSGPAGRTAVAHRRPPPE